MGADFLHIPNRKFLISKQVLKPELAAKGNCLSLETRGLFPGRRSGREKFRHKAQALHQAAGREEMLCRIWHTNDS